MIEFVYAENQNGDERKFTAKVFRGKTENLHSLCAFYIQSPKLRDGLVKTKKNLVIAESGENDCFDDWKLLCVTVFGRRRRRRKNFSIATGIPYLRWHWRWLPCSCSQRCWWLCRCRLRCGRRKRRPGPICPNKSRRQPGRPGGPISTPDTSILRTTKRREKLNQLNSSDGWPTPKWLWTTSQIEREFPLDWWCEYIHLRLGAQP